MVADFGTVLNGNTKNGKTLQHSLKSLVWDCEVEALMVIAAKDLEIRRNMKNQTSNPEWTNFLEVRAYGLMRSGNHAIIEWVQNQHSDQVICFLNNVKHGDHDPYTSYKEMVLRGIDEPIDTEDLRKMNKRLLIYSYEDREETEVDNKSFLESVFQQEFEAKRQCYLGTSRHQVDMLIIRDPYNFLASRLKLLQVRGSMEGASNPALMMKNWKIMAREAVKLLQNPEPGKIVANFNRWATNRAYRKQFSKLLMGTFDDSSMNNVPRFGGGSSFRDPNKLTTGMILTRWKKLFDLKRYAQFGHYWKRFTAAKEEKKVFDRWKHFATDETFLELVRDREILELSEKLFGVLPGTRELIKTVKM